MDNDVLRKETLVKYLNSLSADKLIDIVKEIISNHIDAIYSREILEVVMQKDDAFKNKIDDIDKKEIYLDYYRYKKRIG